MKITIIGIMMVLCMVVITAETSAEARAPALVISAFVEALQKDDMEYLKEYVDLEKISQQPRHGYTISTLKKLFENVQVNDIELSKPRYDEKMKIITVSMNKPLSFDFVLQHQSALIGKGDFYRIVGIHP